MNTRWDRSILEHTYNHERGHESQQVRVGVWMLAVGLRSDVVLVLDHFLHIYT
jgi:hypothetical protein